MTEGLNPFFAGHLVGLMEFIIARSTYSGSAADLVKMRVKEVFISSLARNPAVFGVFQHTQPAGTLKFLKNFLKNFKKFS